MFVHWVIPEKIKLIVFPKKPLEFLDLSLNPWKVQTKWSFNPGCCYCVTPIGIPKAKHQNSIEISHDFFLSPQEISFLFLLTPVISIFYFFNIPENSMSSASLVWIFLRYPILAVIGLSETKKKKCSGGCSYLALSGESWRGAYKCYEKENYWITGEIRKPCHDERFVFNFALFYSVMFVLEF